MKYKVEDMICNTCKTIVEMTFKDKGYVRCSIDSETKQLTVQDDVQCDKTIVTSIIGEMEVYKVIKI